VDQLNGALDTHDAAAETVAAIAQAQAMSAGIVVNANAKD